MAQNVAQPIFAKNNAYCTMKKAAQKIALLL
jgi:hypothetical protein